MKRQDLTLHSENELSLWVFNDEGLYRMRRYSLPVLKALLSELFIFTQHQWEVLIDDIEQDEIEDNKAV